MGKDNGGYGKDKNLGEMTAGEQIEKVKNIAGYYQEKGSDALVADIFKSVLAQKNAGALNNKQLMEFAKKISPMLGAEQRARLDELMEGLLKL